MNKRRRGTPRLYNLFAEVFGEGVGVGIAVVGGVVLFFQELPDVGRNLGEERVGIGESMVDMRDIEFVRQGHELTIDHAAAYDEIFLVLVCQTDGIFDGICHLRPLNLFARNVGNDDIAPVGQGMMRQRKPGAFAHDDSAAGSDEFEMFQVVGHVTEQVALTPYGVVFCYGYDDG